MGRSRRLGPMGDPTCAGWRRLAAAVLLRALEDARDGNGHSAEARAFLQSAQAGDLVLALDLEPADLERVIGGLPEPIQPALPGMF